MTDHSSTPGLRCPCCGGTDTDNYDLGGPVGHNECLTCGVAFPDNMAWPLDAPHPPSFVVLDSGDTTSRSE